ncbi:MAG TPA: DNA-protecting protein DprA, partial [Thermoanaerobaculia bacterium]|nr:DNA-protecting protein DprA [Thermoanaerobaculia bacterium]
RLALEGGREVFAVPGSIFSQTSEGGHRLIQDGAKLLHSMDDLWNELPFRPPAAAAVAAGRTLEPHGEIAAIFPPDEGLTVDQAAEKLGMRIEVLAPRLFELEMRGRIRALPGARYVRLEE